MYVTETSVQVNLFVVLLVHDCTETLIVPALN